VWPDASNERATGSRKDDEARSERERSVIRQSIIRTVDGAVEAAGIVPTWIAATAGVAGITSEVLSLTTAAVLTALVAALSAMILFYVFSQLDYYGLEEGLRRRWLMARNKRELLSRVIMAANALVILLALTASLVSHDGAPKGAAPDHQGSFPVH